MATIVKIDTRSKAAKNLLDYLKTLSFVTVEEKKPRYTPEFIKKIKESEKQIEKGDYKEIDANDIWGSLGL